MRKRRLIIISLISVILPFFSCSREPLPVVQEEDGERTLPMVFAGGVTAFDDATKAPAEFSFSNENVVYLRLTDPRDAGHPLIGRATYDKTQSPARWQFTYQGSYDNLSSGTVEAYLFENNHSKERSVLNISYRTPIYGAEDGSFSIANDTLKINASLKPVTGRVTFVKENDGSSVWVNALSGISYYNRFDIDSFSFESSPKAINYGEMFFGDYIYGFLTNEAYPILSYQGSNYYVTTVSNEFLKKGESGVFNLPNGDNRNGWLYCYSNFVFWDNYSYIRFRFMGAGTYTMGGKDAFPAHQVTITQPFFIMQSEVTRDFWQFICEDNEFENETIAVTGKNYEQIQSFIDKLNERWPQYSFRLPTEAEWELAAKGSFFNYSDYRYSGSNSTNGYVYLYSDDIHDEDNPFYYWANQRNVNGCQLFDMSGNAAELCSDWFADYTAEDAVNPVGPETGTYHVVRGGSAYDFSNLERLTVTHRCSEADYPLEQIGFRLVFSVTPFTFD